jgi:hypothetical protein
MSRRGREGDIGVEQLDLGSWSTPGGDWTRPAFDPASTNPGAVSGPPSAPPRPPDDKARATGGDPSPAAGSWWRRHTGHLVAGAGGFALLVAVVAVASDPGDAPSAGSTTAPTTAAPSTTAGRPVETAAPSTTEPRPTSGGAEGPADGGRETATDYRFVLTDAPEGFAPMGVDELTGDDSAYPAPPMLFAADGTTWATGPWLLISSGGEYSPGVIFPFTRPTITWALDDGEAETGPGAGGVEVTTFARDGREASVAGRGLDGLTTAAVAAQLAVNDDTLGIPDAAIPAGLRARPDIDVTPWEWQWVPGTRTSVSYGSIDGDGWMTVNVRPRGLAPDVFGAATYLLSDVRYLVVGGATAIAGTYPARFGDPVQYVVWQLADREYVAMGTGIALDELIASVGSVAQPGDPAWRQDRWDDLRTAVRQCCNDPRGDSPTGPPALVPSASADDRWDVEVRVDGDTVRWDGSSPGGGDFVGVATPAGAPLLRIGTRARWPGMPAEFPVIAVALVDRSMRGSTLRLTTTGSTAQTVEVALQPLDHAALAPYLAGAVVVPWLDGGFVAQLIAPDGQTIAVQTDADLP